MEAIPTPIFWRRWPEAQQAADKVAIIPNGRASIAETLPALFEV